MTYDAVRGRSGTNSHSLSRGRVLPSIDMLADLLDPRLTYTRAGNLLYWADDGSLKQAGANVFPIEYVDGKKVGRHQPEPEATNLQVWNRAASTASGHVVRTTAMDPAATGAPDGGAIGRVQSSADGFLFSQDDGGVTLKPFTAYGAQPAKWKREVMPATITLSSKVRTWIGRNSQGDGSPYVYLTQGAKMNAGDIVGSFFHKAGDADGFLAGLVQLERSKVATSPIICEGGDTVTRSAASWSIATMGARGCKLRFSNGDVEPYWFGAGASFTLPTSPVHWATRYLTRIEYF